MIHIQLPRATALSLVLAFIATAALAPAQRWRVARIDEVGLKISVPERLERLPMKLGPETMYHRARLVPKDRNDLIRARYPWYCNVMEFRKKNEAEREIDDSMSEEQKELERKIREIMGRSMKRHESFESWLMDMDSNRLEVKQKGRLVKKRSPNLSFRHWKWRYRDRQYGPVGVLYCEAAVYEIDGKEVALVIQMPLEKGKAKKPKSKWNTIIKRMISSGRKLAEEGEAKEDNVRDKYADTPEKKAALEAARANTKNIPGWDYFTTPNYIVLYSWDFEDPAKRAKAKKQAKFYSSRLEKMRDLYVTHYPLDESGTIAVMPDPSSLPNAGPTTGSQEEQREREKERDKAVAEAMETHGAPYSVFRLCATYDQFQKYGETRGGVVGWYSPRSKELVVFLGGDKMMGQGATETVTYHEGWHQFADLYFHPPGQPTRARLHRWFDEGHGDFFGSFRYSNSKWIYKGSAMRNDSVKNMVRVGDYVPFKDIVTWHMRRFYGPKAAYYYAQAYSMIDFFRRGKKLTRHWNPRYGKILEWYRTSMLLYGEDEKAVDTAFNGFTDQDWTALESAWKEWVGSSHWMGG